MGKDFRKSLFPKEKIIANIKQIITKFYKQETHIFPRRYFIKSKIKAVDITKDRVIEQIHELFSNKYAGFDKDYHIKLKSIEVMFV